MQSTRDYIKILAAMQTKSKGIWTQSSNEHRSDINGLMFAITSIFEWKKTLMPKNYECSFLLNESIFDLLGSINSMMNGYYRQGMFSLRSFLEMVLGLVYYVDHPLEFKLWRLDRGSNSDSRPSKWINDGFLDDQYIDFFIKKEKIKIELNNEIRNLYKKLSQFIHGQKENTMQINQTSLKLTYNKGRFNISKEYFLETVRLANVVLIVRFFDDFNKSNELKIKIPKCFIRISFRACYATLYKTHWSYQALSILRYLLCSLMYLFINH